MPNEICKKWIDTTERTIFSVVLSPIIPQLLVHISSVMARDILFGLCSDNVVCVVMLLMVAVPWDKIGSRVPYMKEKSWFQVNILTNSPWISPWPDIGAPLILNNFPEKSQKTTILSRTSSWTHTLNNTSLHQSSNYLNTAVLITCALLIPNAAPWEDNPPNDASYHTINHKK